MDAGTRLVVVGSDTVSVYGAPSLRLLHSALITPALRSPSAAAISPDGRVVAVGSQTGSLSFVDAVTGEARRALGGQGAAVDGLVYSADGKTVVSVGDDNRVVVWNPADERQVRVAGGPLGQVQNAAISATGTTLYTASLTASCSLGIYRGANDSDTASAWVRRRPAVSPSRRARRRWRCQTTAPGSRSGSGHRPWVFSPLRRWHARRRSRSDPRADHHRAGVVTERRPGCRGRSLRDRGAVERGRGTAAGAFADWSALTGGLPQAIQTVAFSPDGKLLAASAQNATLSVHESAAFPLATLAIWRSDNGTLVAPPRELAAGNGPGGSDVLAFSPDGKLLAVSLLHGGVLVLDPSTGRLRRTLPDAGDDIISLAFARDGTLAAGTLAGTVDLWNPANGERVAPPLLAAAAPIASIAFDPSGQRFVTSGDQDGSVKLWSAASLQQEGPDLNTDQNGTSAVAFRPGSGRLLAVDDLGNAFAWPTSLAALEHRACAVAARNLSRKEWRRFVGALKYATVCP